MTYLLLRRKSLWSRTAGLDLRRTAGLLMLACVTSLSGCGEPTKRQLGEPYWEQAESLEEELSTLAIEIPMSEQFNNIQSPLDPEPYYHVFDGLSNTIVMSTDELIGSFVDVNSDDYFSLYSAAKFRSLLSDMYASEPAEPGFLEELKSAVNVRYVIAYVTPSFRDAVQATRRREADGPKVEGFDQQPFDLIVALYDRHQQAWLLSERFTIDPPEQLHVTGSNGSFKQRMQSEARSFLRTRAKKRISDLIQSSAGGRIEFDGQAVRRDGTQDEGLMP